MNRSLVFVVLLTAALWTSTATAQDSQSPATKDAAANAAPIVCPVTGKPINRDVVIRFRGHWLYFADEDARKKFEADPYAYADGIQAQWEANKPLRTQVKCPVTGEPVNPEVYVGQGDDAVFFATEEAKAKWVKDSAPFRKRLEQECYTFQTLCPHSAMDFDPKVSRQVDGRTIYFMCDGCAAAFDEDKAKYIKIFDDQIKANKAAWEKKVAAEKKASAEKPRPAGESK